MPYSATFWAQGEPEPKGSARALLINGRPTVIPDNAHFSLWERTVKLAASRCAPEGGPIDRPIALRFRFVMPRPKNPSFWCPATRPDWDKLSRSTGDALNKMLYVDDARVVRATVDLEYGETPGAMISVRELERVDPLFCGEEAKEAIEELLAWRERHAGCEALADVLARIDEVTR